MPTVKACTKCGEVKPLDGFSKDKRAKDGKQSCCKECVSEYHRRHYEENREAILERNRRYREENLEKVRERELHYRDENREEKREYDRRYHYENREEILQYKHRYREENREVVNAKTSSHKAVDQELSKALSSVQAGTPWSEEEDVLLMSDNGMTIYEKAIHLGRTYNSCATRRRNIRNLRRTTNV